MGAVSGGRPRGFSGSMGSDQSMRLAASHCLSLPFLYSARSLSRPSSYSHVNRLSPASGTLQISRSVGIAYLSYVLTARLARTAYCVLRTLARGVRDREETRASTRGFLHGL